MRRIGPLLFAFTVAPSAAGCAASAEVSVGVGHVSSAPSHPAIRVYAAGIAPPGYDVGPIEVHGTERDARIDRLTGQFLDKVAAAGGDSAVIDSVVPRFEVLEHPREETFTYLCGTETCSEQRLFAAGDEVLVVSMRGRAFRTTGGAMPAHVNPFAPPPLPSGTPRIIYAPTPPALVSGMTPTPPSAPPPPPPLSAPPVLIEPAPAPATPAPSAPPPPGTSATPTPQLAPLPPAAPGTF